MSETMEENTEGLLLHVSRVNSMKDIFMGVAELHRFTPIELCEVSIGLMDSYIDRLACSGSSDGRKGALYLLLVAIDVLTDKKVELMSAMAKKDVELVRRLVMRNSELRKEGEKNKVQVNINGVGG